MKNLQITTVTTTAILSAKPKGFSILELLLVLVIMAILAGVVGVKFAGQSEKARISATKGQLSEIKTALNIYELEVGTFPTSQQGLEALIEEPSGVENWPGKKLDYDQVPQDSWGNEFQYRYPGTKNEDGYDLYSYGPDGKEGGDDDITNWSGK